MSQNSCKLENMLAAIKLSLTFAAITSFTLWVLLLLSAYAINDWPRGMVKAALCVAYIYVLLDVWEAVFPNLSRICCHLRYPVVTLATALALFAMIEFAVYDAPTMEWPLQNEWRAQFVALGIVMIGVANLVPPAIAWIASKRDSRS